MSCPPDPSYVSTLDTSVNYHTEIRSDSTKSAGQIDGVVMSAQSGKPVEGVIVYFLVDGTNRLPGVATDSEGAFRFMREPEEKVVLQARGLGYKWELTTVDTRAAVSVKIAIRVTRLVLMC